MQKNVSKLREPWKRFMQPQVKGCLERRLKLGLHLAAQGGLQLGANRLLQLQKVAKYQSLYSGTFWGRKRLWNDVTQRRLGRRLEGRLKVGLIIRVREKCLSSLNAHCLFQLHGWKGWVPRIPFLELWCSSKRTLCAITYRTRDASRLEAAKEDSNGFFAGLECTGTQDGLTWSGANKNSAHFRVTDLQGLSDG